VALTLKGEISMIKVHLSTLLGKRKWKQAELCRRTRIRANAISALYNETANAIAFDHLLLICKALECDISDLLEIVPDETRQGSK